MCTLWNYFSWTEWIVRMSRIAILCVTDLNQRRWLNFGMPIQCRVNQVETPKRLRLSGGRRENHQVAAQQSIELWAAYSVENESDERPGKRKRLMMSARRAFWGWLSDGELQQVCFECYIDDCMLWLCFVNRVNSCE